MGGGTSDEVPAFNRRTLIKTGTAAITMPALFGANSARAQTKIIKIGHVSPRTGPLAGFGEADGFIIEQVRGVVKDGLQSGGTPLSSADHSEGQPVERQPRS